MYYQNDLITGIILFGGLGTRLAPLTNNLNKHLLKIDGEEIAVHNVKFLVNSGVNKIIAVINSADKKRFTDLLGDGNKFKANITYVEQNSPGGTAQAVGLCKNLVTTDYVVAMWGDNLFERSLNCSLKIPLKKNFCRIYLAQANDPKNFGVVYLDRKGKIIMIIDKPMNPTSNWICTGFFCFGRDGFDKINNVKQNFKGERDFMDVVRMYLVSNQLEFVKISGAWCDMGVSCDEFNKATKKT